jgi:Protein of unknown function (DUF3866)
MLKLRSARVVEVLDVPSSPAGDTAPDPEQSLVVELASPFGGGHERRRAIADVGLVGTAEVGDEVVVNVEALDLGLGSGGFDVVHVNLTRGLSAGAPVSPEGNGSPSPTDHGRGPRDGTWRESGAMKLNYTSLQHLVEPLDDEVLELPVGLPAAVLALHGQLAPLAWAFSTQAPGQRLGYVQSEGGALPGGHSRVVRELRHRGLLAGHLTAGAAFGGEGEAVSVAGALHHGLTKLGWDAAVCGPGPGIVGSGSMLGHGGMAALDSAHVALALGCPTLVVARMSSSDQRERHRGISHHTLTVLDLLLEPVTVALPAGMRSPVGSDLAAKLGAVFGESGGPRPAIAVDVERPVRLTRHDWRRAAVDLPGFAASGLPTVTMGRSLAEDPLFFASALAGGGALSELAREACAPASTV